MQSEIALQERKRLPVVAGLLSLFFPGVGQVYNGQFRKGLVFYGILLLIPLILAATRLQFRFAGAVLLIGLIYSFYLFSAVEAFVQARRKKAILLRRYNKWYVYLLVVLIMSGINVAARPEISTASMGIRSFKLPTAGMQPSLLIGDRIIVELSPYETRAPQRGDIVVFKFPEDPSRYFIKRIVALGGETIESRNKNLYINGVPLDEPYVVHYDTEVKEEECDPRDNFGPIVIPDGHYFFMGDNRDRSYDSRYWGTVKRDALYGKALYIYWSWDDENDTARFDRIGKTISESPLPYSAVTL